MLNFRIQRLCEWVIYCAHRQTRTYKPAAWWSFVAKKNPNSQLISTYALKNNENEYAA
jgi:hypothetical protein